jgi:hypothetical protein
MIWIQNGLLIFVLFDSADFPAWQFAPDTYLEGEILPDVGLNPPAGLLIPQRGFGKLWRSDTVLQGRLGWGITPEVAYTTFVQADSVTGTQYILGPSGEIYSLLAGQTRWIRER